MWNSKQNFIPLDQTNAPERFQGHFIESLISPSPSGLHDISSSGFLSESSRKRKSIPQHNDKSDGDENINDAKKVETVNDPSHNSDNLNERRELPSELVNPNFTEKLWDGSLQLSSSVTVPALAFFKSGEKIPVVNWYKFVEVKGNVRLAAFEKYIEDLPRARSRGLMVISLCCKEGSPKAGLAGMKQVAKKFEKGSKVGVAKLSQGADLYICPRSDAIYTILAKYGHLKGMSVVGDNQDSLIGCVIWRRNYKTPSSSLEKISKEQNKSNISNVSIPNFSTQEDKSNDFIDSKVQLETCSSLVRENFIPDLVEAPISQFSEPGKFEENLGISKPDMPLMMTEVKVKHVNIPYRSSLLDEKQGTFLIQDVDDLPEFDFNATCRTSQTPSMKSSNVSTLVINHGVSMPKKVCVRDTLLSVSLLEKKYDFPRDIIEASRIISLPKNRFDDGDDDMPEWCPPSEYIYHPVNETMKPSMPNALMGFNPTPVLAPPSPSLQSLFDGNVTRSYAGWRG